MQSISHLALTVILVICCGQQQAIADQRQSPEADSSKSSVDRMMPKLTRRILRPIAEKSQFDISDDLVTFPRLTMVPKANQTTFERDTEAIQAAHMWTEKHFGKLPKDVSLSLQQIQHSSSARDKPAFDWDIGFTLTFQEMYKDVPTDGAMIVYITGKTDFKVVMHIYSYEPIPGSERKILSESEAVTLFKRFRSRNHQVETSEIGAKEIKPMLGYTVSIEDLLDPEETAKSRVTPHWVMDREWLWLVDAHSGRVWHND